MEGIMVINCSLHSGSALNGVPYSEPKALTNLSMEKFPTEFGGHLTFVNMLLRKEKGSNA